MIVGYKLITCASIITQKKYKQMKLPMLPLCYRKGGEIKKTEHTTI